MRTKEARRIRNDGLKRAWKNGHVVATICEGEAFSAYGCYKLQRHHGLLGFSGRDEWSDGTPKVQRAGCKKKYFNPNTKTYHKYRKSYL